MKEISYTIKNRIGIRIAITTDSKTIPPITSDEKTANIEEQIV
jgi:hypothetical protein